MYNYYIMRNLVNASEPLSLETIFRIAYDLKKRGKTIGYTHGAFDLFHYGHLYLLRKSAEKCDFLVVGIDSDRNIAQYKSYTRPVINEKRRLEIISELNCVGAAFINDFGANDEAHIMLGKELKAKILTAGRAYSREDGLRREAEKIKARIHWFKRNFESTTKIIERIVQNHALKYPNEEAKSFMH